MVHVSFYAYSRVLVVEWANCGHDLELGGRDDEVFVVDWMIPLSEPEKLTLGNRRMSVASSMDKVAKRLGELVGAMTPR